MSVSRIANRYAKSLIDLSVEQKVLDKVHAEVLDLAQLLRDSRDLYSLAKSPIVKEDKKLSIFTTLLQGQISDLTMAFLRIVIQKKREPHLMEILQSFVDQYNVIKEITPVKLTTATAVNASFEQAVIELMQQQFGKKTIELTTTVNTDIIGGFTLEFDGQRLDASVASQLAGLRKEFHKNIQYKN